MNAILIEQGLLAMLDLYTNHYQKAKDWVPSAQEIADMRIRNRDMTARQYELDAAKELGIEPPKDLTIPS